MLASGSIHRPQLFTQEIPSPHFFFLLFHTLRGCFADHGWPGMAPLGGLWEYWRVRDLFVGLQAFTWFTCLQMDGTWVTPVMKQEKTRDD